MIRRPLIALALAQACCAWAQGDDAPLRRELEELRARMSAIEKRLGTAPADAPLNAPAASAASPTTYPAAWLRIRHGMTREQVKELLGEPKKAFGLDGSLVWYYRYDGNAAGSVFFDSAGQASSFQMPSGLRSW